MEANEKIKKNQEQEIIEKNSNTNINYENNIDEESDNSDNDNSSYEKKIHITKKRSFIDKYEKYDRDKSTDGGSGGSCLIY